jgi:predicted nucleic acid-binding Zn ribbon protein
MPGLLQESLQSLGLAERLRDAEIWRVWNDAVGAVVAIRAQPLRIINGTLTVAVSSAPWMQELRFMTGMMKEKLNDRLGAEVVREIVLKAGRVDTSITEETQEKLHKKRMTSSQKALIEEHSSSITDPETRQAFAELMKASFESQT